MLFHVFWFRSSICSVFIYTCVYEWSSDHNCFKCRLFYPIYLLLGLCVCFMYKFIVVINILKWKKKRFFSWTLWRICKQKTMNLVFIWFFDLFSFSLSLFLHFFLSCFCFYFFCSFLCVLHSKYFIEQLNAFLAFYCTENFPLKIGDVTNKCQKHLLRPLIHYAPKKFIYQTQI